MFPEIDQLNEEVWQSGTNDAPAGLKKANIALNLSIEKNYPEGQADSYLNIGRCQIFISELNEARINLKKALDSYRDQSGERSDTGEMRALNALGVVSFELEEYENALNYYFMALTESELDRNDEIRILALNNVGEIHRVLNNKEEALGYFHQAFQIAENLKTERNIGTTSINLGELYLLLNDLSEAEEYFKSALTIAEGNNYLQMKADALLGLGKIMLQNNDQQAEAKISEAEMIFSNIGDRISINVCRFQLGLLELQRKNYDEAEKIIARVNAAADELNHTDLQSRCSLRLSEIYKQRQKYKEALECYEKYKDLESSLGNESLRNRLKKITILYETEQTVTEKEAYRMQSLNLEKSNKEIEFINEIGQQITSSLELDEIIYSTFARLSEIIDISSFGVALYDESTKEIRFRYIMEEGEKLDPFIISTDSKSSLAVYCLLNKTPLLINEEKEAEKYIAHWKKGEKSIAINSAIYMPMQQGGRMIGCLTIQNAEKNMYTQSDLDTVGAVSTFLAIALDNSRVHAELNKLNEIITNEKQGLEVAYQKIAHMANHDALTDLPNRHLLSELLKRGIKTAKRSGTQLAVLFMDLDNFKAVNDTLGHDSGDEVLKIAANRLASSLRASDTIARNGGDEFVAVLYNIETEKGVLSVAKKIIETLSEEIILKGKSFQLGASIGISLYPQHDTEISGLMLKADQAMYKAKQAGKNRTQIYSK